MYTANANKISEITLGTKLIKDFIPKININVTEVTTLNLKVSMHATRVRSYLNDLLNMSR